MEAGGCTEKTPLSSPPLIVCHQLNPSKIQPTQKPEHGSPQMSWVGFTKDRDYQGHLLGSGFRVLICTKDVKKMGLGRGEGGVPNKGLR